MLSRGRMKIEELFGGRTRFAVLEALAEAKQPMTAHQIAITNGLDSAATYRCLAEFSEFGIVEPVRKGRNRTSYKLSKGSGNSAVEFLRSLKQKQKQKTSDESIDLKKWISPEMQARRMAKIDRLDRIDTNFNTSTLRTPTERIDIDKLMSQRVPGELSALIASSRIAFNELFEQNGKVFTLKAKA